MKIQKIDMSIFDKLTQKGKELLDRAYTFTDKDTKDNPNPCLTFVYDNGKNSIYATDTRVLIHLRQSTGQKMLFNRHIVRLDEDLINRYPKFKKVLKISQSSHHKLFVSFLPTLRELCPFYDTICFKEGNKTLLYPDYCRTRIFELPILDISYFVKLSGIKEPLHFDFARFLKLFYSEGGVFEVFLCTDKLPKMMGFSTKFADYRLVLKYKYAFLDTAITECFNYNELTEYAFLLKNLVKFCKNADEYDTLKIRVEGNFITFSGDLRKEWRKLEIKSPFLAKFNIKRLKKIFKN